MSTIGQTISLWRIHRGLSQAGLAEKAGIPRPNISRIESDKHDISLKTIRIIASELSVTPGRLVDGQLPDESAGTPEPLTRPALERIARAASSGKKLKNPLEQSISENLALVIAPRLSADAGKTSRLQRSRLKGQRAWWKLSRLSEEDRKSLIERAAEHA